LPSALADGYKEYFNIRLQPKLRLILAEADLFLINIIRQLKQTAMK